MSHMTLLDAYIDILETFHNEELSYNVRQCAEAGAWWLDRTYLYDRHGLCGMTCVLALSQPDRVTLCVNYDHGDGSPIREFGVTVRVHEGRIAVQSDRLPTDDRDAVFVGLAMQSLLQQPVIMKVFVAH